ncbi:MAG: acyl--CoA ligase [Fimbriimonadaceae bacterium]|nr:acyl--CoA ligase [Fimbriimonadaceae bacterium]
MPGLPLATLTDVWLNTVGKYPNKVALVMDGQRYTYRDLDARVRRLAGRLVELGLQPGDRVAVAMPNCLEFYLAYWATMLAGGVLAPINFRLGRDEMSYVFGNVAAAVIFLHHEVAPAVLPALPDAGHRIVVGLPDGEPFAAAESGPPLTTPVRLDGEALGVIAHTSGTTGVPKGAMMRHVDLLFNIRNTTLPFSWRHEDVNLLLSPLFHVVALYSIVPSSVYLGATVVVAQRPDPREVVDLMEAEQVTCYLSVPAFHHLVISLPDIAQRDLRSLRMIGYSGSPMPVRTIHRLAELFPHARLHNFFGLTETISLTHITPSPCAVSHAESIGKTIPDVGVRIVREDGSDCDFGETGLLHIHRENTIRGYWNRPGLLEEALTADGQWFNTGDLARVDPDGFVYLEGRQKEMIIVAGENVFALEVERCLLQLDGLKEVAVVGIPATGARAALGELVKAVVVLLPGAALTARDIRRHCVERLASYKVPQVVEFREALPRNPSGKVLKRELVAPAGG